MDPGSAKLDMVNTVDAHAHTPQKRKPCPDEASTEPWSVAKSDMTVTSDMGRWEKADLDDSQNEELLTEDLEDLLDALLDHLGKELVAEVKNRCSPA